MGQRRQAHLISMSPIGRRPEKQNKKRGDGQGHPDRYDGRKEIHDAPFYQIAEYKKNGAAALQPPRQRFETCKKV